MIDLDRIAAIVGTTPWMWLSRAREIRDKIQHLQPKRILEIGTFHGAGSCFLGEIARHYHGRVVTVDLDTNATRQPQASDLLAACGLENVEVITRPGGAQDYFQEHFTKDDEPFDFIYHDASHQWGTATAIFAMAYCALRWGGMMAIDDIRHEKYPGVELMWQKICPQFIGRIEDEQQNIGWLTKW